jgi:hypothetical protein
VTDQVAAHVEAFNRAVESGDWERFSERFGEDARLAFEGVPVGPFAGRDAIAAVYSAQPPTDTMSVVAVETEGAVDTVRFRWSAGGTGTMRMTWSGGQVEELVVSFDTHADIDDGSDTESQ